MAMGRKRVPPQPALNTSALLTSDSILVLFLLVYLCVGEGGLDVWQRLASRSPPSSLCFLSAGLTCPQSHTWSQCHFKSLLVYNPVPVLH